MLSAPVKWYVIDENILSERFRYFVILYGFCIKKKCSLKSLFSQRVESLAEGEERPVVKFD